MKKLCVVVSLIICLIMSACSSTEEKSNSQVQELTKYNITLNIECVENLLFSRYDVDVLVDSKEIATLEHGSQDTYSIELTEGEHTISFKKEDDNSVDGNIKISVSEDSVYKYKISCTSDQIKIEELQSDKGTVETEKEKVETESKSKDNSNTSTITMPYSYTYYIGRQYKEVEKELKKLGFKKYDYNEVEIDDENEVAGEIKEIYVEDWIFTDKFKKGDTYDSDCTIKVYYYVNPPKLETLTIENCPDLNSLLYGNEDYSVYSNFASKYNGQLIEFDGRIDYVVNYKDYDTRYELLVSAGDYDPDSQTGPSFKFEDVNSFDLGLDTMYLDDEIWVGRNVHIIAEVEEFNSNTGLFFLDPVSVIGR